MTNYEVVYNGSMLGGDMLTVCHFQGSELTDEEKQIWADLIRSEMVDDLQGALMDEVSYTGITIREDIPGSVGVTYPFTSGTLTGTNGSTSLIPQNAMLLRKYADSAVRPNQGRIYQGGVPANAVNSDGRFAGQTVTDVQTFWQDQRIVNLVGGASLQMVIKASNPSAPNTVAYNPVARIVAAAIPVTQRRRKEGQGS